ncbi:hypothetical protein DS909_17165 [Phaeobacter gallaeciensis]|uniref:DUF1453 domain-containing protein n=2 Tax=Roseobacteraceae TaxID=2854170 RepID=A0A366WWE8_9RHOB|nr:MULTISPECIES: hypothetical protein [Roseobacteraceae]MBT3143868.1 hypothetical protein [Falsiruegeria litorea]RBW52432.1 hypothetical protein DS909_17165 [Phaeobacter gallaeciensis]
MPQLFSILSGAPLWVWPLLVFLIYFGLKATLTRTVPTWPLFVLPLLGVLSVNAVNGLSPAASIWVLFGLAYIVGAGLGFQFQRSIVSEKSGASVTLAGEWITLLVIMVVFWMNFFGGVVRVVAPDVFAATAFHQIFAAIAGLAAGSFLGRAARVFITER